MKKLVALFLALVMVMSVSLAMADEDRVLNICTPNSDGLRSIYPLFEEETGIKINSESLGTGDCMARIKAEKEQEYCSFDLMYGGLHIIISNFSRGLPVPSSRAVKRSLLMTEILSPTSSTLAFSFASAMASSEISTSLPSSV